MQTVGEIPGLEYLAPAIRHLEQRMGWARLSACVYRARRGVEAETKGRSVTSPPLSDSDRDDGYSTR